jgi:hypothetical protein
MLRWAVLQGHAPFAPHLLYPGALDDGNAPERNSGLAAGMEFLRCCHELWWLDGPKGVTSGMAAELALATDLGIPKRKVSYTLSPDNGVWEYNFNF